jgi:hypothetical protein
MTRDTPPSPGPTIDLQATEIAREPAAETAADAAASAAAAEPKAGFPWRLIGAAAAGAALMLIGVAIGGFFSQDKAVSETRIGGLEQQMRALAARPVSADAGTIGDLAARTARIEAALASPRPQAVDPALANRMSMLEGETKALGERIGVVARRTDDIATGAKDTSGRLAETAAALSQLRAAARRAPPPVTAGELQALAGRVAATEQAVQQIAKAGGDRTVRMAVTAALLKSAVERGESFASELAAARTLAADPKVLAPLEPFAAAGVPTAAALTRELAGIIPKLAQAADAAPAHDGGIFDRMAANAEKLVRVTPLEGAPGDSPAATVSRITARARDGDIAGALTELATLAPAARAPAQAWIAKAEARNAALAASRALAADALAALAKPAP